MCDAIAKYLDPQSVAREKTLELKCASGMSRPVAKICRLSLRKARPSQNRNKIDGCLGNAEFVRVWTHKQSVGLSVPHEKEAFVR